jgi:hypothetical protein
LRNMTRQSESQQLAAAKQYKKNSKVDALVNQVKTSFDSARGDNEGGQNLQPRPEFNLNVGKALCKQITSKVELHDRQFSNDASAYSRMTRIEGFVDKFWEIVARYDSGQRSNAPKPAQTSQVEQLDLATSTT